MLGACVHNRLMTLQTLAKNADLVPPETVHQVRDGQGGSLLHVAASKGYDEIVLLLLEDIKLSTTVVNDAQLTHADMAKQAGHLQIAAALGGSKRQTGAEPTTPVAEAAPAPTNEPAADPAPAPPAAAPEP